ncbi:heme ABC transporter ATP-binding protein [Hwanghaeella sp.]|uniref:heme ABC transporter ATP-binding protein n=1 Tax=Hwanghaeella sp. TaxID=2605943 RepID=UPI003CCC2818
MTISLRGVGASLAGKRVLQGIDLQILPGQVTALVGPNGAGKSTLLGVMAGDIEAADGEVALHGSPIRSIPPKERASLRTVMRQSFEMSFAFLVRDIVEMGVLDQVPEREKRHIVDRALRETEMTAFRNRPVTRLSGGERQRVSFTRAVAQIRSSEHLDAPRFLFLDEPTASLDMAYQALILNRARSFAAEGLGVVIVLHDLNLAAAAADRILLLSGGRVVTDGPPETVVREEVLAPAFAAPVSVFEADGGRHVAVRLGE